MELRPDGDQDPDVEIVAEICPNKREPDVCEDFGPVPLYVIEQLGQLRQLA